MLSIKLLAPRDKKSPSQCRHCQQEILDGQRRYYSRQAGMKGHYHWDCFVEACRQANNIGNNNIQTITNESGYILTDENDLSN